MRFILLVSALLLSLTPAYAADVPTPIKVSSRDIAVADNVARGIAPLELRMVLALSSTDDRFGGYSGAVLSKDGTRILVLSDAGTMLSAKLVRDNAGVVTKVTDTHIFPLLGPDGQAMKVKALADSESITWAPSHDAVFIAFEIRHRVWRYALPDNDFLSLATAWPKAVNAAPALARLPDNGGVEAMTTAPDGTLLLFSEEGEAEGGGRKAWRFKDGVAAPFTYANPAPYVPTDAAFLADGKILILNRHFSPSSGASAVLSWISYEETELGGMAKAHEIARFEPGFPVDNFEALAVHPNDDGSYELFILSDDNFNPLQRTLLIQARLPAEALN